MIYNYYLFVHNYAKTNSNDLHSMYHICNYDWLTVTQIVIHCSVSHGELACLFGTFSSEMYYVRFTVPNKCVY